MIERIIEFSCRRRWFVISCYALFTLFGLVVASRTPVDAIPDLSENQVIVFTDWVGRSPQEIEDQVTYPLSVSLQGLAGVRTVRSSSEFNFSMITIIFEDSVDFYFARNRVLERLSLARTFLPEGVTPYLAPDATALGQILWYTLSAENYDLGSLRSVQDWFVRYQLSAVPGVAEVASVGGAPKEYQIDVDPEKLRAYGITLGELVDAVERSNRSVGGRVVQKGNAEYVVRGVGWLQSLQDIRSIVVQERAGVPIFVGDLASVQTGPGFRRSVLEWEGREVVGGVVLMRFGENPLEVTERVRDRMKQLESGLPEGVHLRIAYDRTQLIHGAIRSVTTVLEHEIIIAALAILLLLTHLRSVFVVVVTLPIAILFSLVLMRVVGISSNIMSLSGIAISIGILVDQAIVMLENATHRLSEHFGTKPVEGDTTEIVLPALLQVGRPIFFSVLIMLLSFAPVFVLSGQEGKLFHPLAWTKTLALIGTALASITLVPALIPLLIRGKLWREENNVIIRSVTEIYRPVLARLMERPRLVIWLFVVLLSFGFAAARTLGHEFMPPLDEGAILDMPVTAPRVSVTQVSDSLKERTALLRGFPEIESVLGKAGRAETATDPSPLDMAENIVNLRPKPLWLKRAVHEKDLRHVVRDSVTELRRQGVKIEESRESAALSSDSLLQIQLRYNAAARAIVAEQWAHVEVQRDAAVPTDEELDWKHESDQRLYPKLLFSLAREAVTNLAPELPAEQVVKSAEAVAQRASAYVFFWQLEREQLLRELDETVHQVGWANIWTQPIINRVDMLSTGVRTQLAVKVFGRSLKQIQEVSNRVAEILRSVPGAADVVADQSVGKGYLEIVPDRERSARYGISVEDVQQTIEIALGGKEVTTTVEGRERYPVRLRYARDLRGDEESIARVVIPYTSEQGTRSFVYLKDVATIRVVDGPVMLKSENGLLRGYVQLNVRDRDVVGFVDEARLRVEQGVSLPDGAYLEWTGQFEHQVRARKTLQLIFPVVIALILLILFWTYGDMLHALLMMLAVPGALAGGALMQWLCGYHFSVAVWVGYIACFGMATETGIIMLVYLRDAIERRGGLAGIESLEELREAVTAGAVHRLRPKLLTEGTAIVGLAPMLWASGVGAEVLAPMAAPVIGGLLVADEVIDLFLPVLFYQVERRRWLRLPQGSGHRERVKLEELL